jgi:hypothetical protein
MPDCVPVLFDRCITRSHTDRKHKDFHVKFVYSEEIEYEIV